MLIKGKQLFSRWCGDRSSVEEIRRSSLFLPNGFIYMYSPNHSRVLLNSPPSQMMRFLLRLYISDAAASFVSLSPLTKPFPSSFAFSFPLSTLWAGSWCTVNCYWGLLDCSQLRDKNREAFRNSPFIFYNCRQKLNKRSILMFFLREFVFYFFIVLFFHSFFVP